MVACVSELSTTVEVSWFTTGNPLGIGTESFTGAASGPIKRASTTTAAKVESLRIPCSFKVSVN